MPEADDRPQCGGRDRWTIADLVEITVIAEGGHRVANRRVDGAVCPFSHCDRNLDGLEEQRGDHDGPTRLAVERFDLRVGPEPATRTVDGRDLVFQDRQGQRGVCLLRHDDRGGRADAPEGPHGE